MKFDLHTHHDRCGHAIGNLEDYIKTAINYGLQVIGISDHSPFFASQEDHLKPWVAMAKSEFPNYVCEVLHLKEMYQDKIEVLLGVESDFFPEYIDIYKNIFGKFPFDYIIGSVHRTGGINIFNKQRWEGLKESEYLREKEIYYALIQESAKSKMFDILGHIDAIKARCPYFSQVKTDIVDETLKIIAECDVVIEVNTSGKTKDCGGWYPSDEILERACFYGVKVTFGSDAHEPERVADDWEKVRTFLMEIGYKEWAIFRKRKRVLLSL
ncbi:histidinol-phosphatase [Thermoactinomyces sp. CICC 10521]|uniref:histidinol-phosphatase n=1 Tax=Thermoactinomyces sp. CICC 10521 TaxID=2767426 RepID=UPI0018DE8BF5|nr:histidinol-phosphatase [Thermoactinomyces sp. CICC 10521]MBH8609406.1 histidinol-phosphatase [Thermoactinomyces sp. CICC 10521]